MAVTRPRVINFFSGLRMNEAAALPISAAVLPITMYIMPLCHDKEKAPNRKRLFDVGFTAHLSGPVLPGDIEGLQLPSSISVGDVDIQLTPEGIKTTKETLSKKEAEKYEVVVIPGAKHGFAVGGGFG